MPLELDKSAWRSVVAQVAHTDGVTRMRRVADACNAQAGTDQYMLSTEGPGALADTDYLVTVITAGGEAMRDNQKNQTLLRNFHLAEG